MDLTPAALAAQARELFYQVAAANSGVRAVELIAAALGAVCDAARAEPAKELAQERWQHAACLSIAEGAPGWKEVSQRQVSSVAMRVVGNLRTAYLERVEEVRQLREALEKLIKLQSHYAGLLNDYDGGKRLQFLNAEAWLKRLAELAATEPSHG